MKRNFLNLFLIAIFSIFSLSANAETEERHLGAFTELSLRINAKVHLEQGKEQSVELVGSSSSLGKIITEIKGNKLIIRTKSSKRWFSSDNNLGKIEIYITMPEIDGIFVSGSGDIISEGKIKSRIIDLAISGSGDIDIEHLECNRVDSEISGSGHIVIDKGNAEEEFDIRISGSGHVKASGFKAEDVNVKVSGSGNSYVYANHSLKVRVAGSGDVYYSGSPRIDSSIAGSGKVKRN
ncbi:DUF2807 domain-containing protein [Prolixibacteraceae bacterium JC049]|nr:DUF2807 domain-containing protein [Prolixibacteraceae bacterium JC049]